MATADKVMIEILAYNQSRVQRRERVSSSVHSRHQMLVGPTGL